MNVSVVIAAFNGEKYIEEQLLSIYNQTIKVNEVFIIDDISTDNTVKICEEFIQKGKLENWVVKVNEKNFGVSRNFLKGVSECTGETIFLADQDDIWLNNKVEVMIKEFDKNPGMLSLTSTFLRFNGNTILEHHVKHPNRKNDGLKQILFKEFCSFPYYLGMSMAISRQLIDYCGLNYHGLTHDIFLNFIASINDGLYHLDRVLTKRRTHSESTSNYKIANEVNKIYQGSNTRRLISNNIKLLQKFKLLVSELNSDQLDNVSEIIEKQLIANKIRHDYFKKNSIINCLKNLKIIEQIKLKGFIKDFIELLKQRRIKIE